MTYWAEKLHVDAQGGLSHPIPYEFGDIDARDRREFMEKVLDGVEAPGASLILYVPAGWIWIAEVLVRFLRETASGRCVTLQSCQPKFGRLRFTGQSPDPAMSTLLLDATIWCETVSEKRCMLTGRQGRRRDNIKGNLTLSDEAYELFCSIGHDAILDRMHV